MVANDYPAVLDGSPVTAAGWFNPVGQDLTAAKASVAALGQKGWYADVTNSSTATTATSTETVVQSLTISPAAGLRLEIVWEGEVESTVAGDLISLRIRWKAGATVDTTGAGIRINSKTAAIANNPDAFQIVAPLPVTPGGQITIVATLRRFSGTGTVKVDASSNQDQYLRVNVV